MFYKEFASHFCNYQWELFLVVLSCAHSGAAVTAWATHLLPYFCGEFLFVATSQCVCGVVEKLLTDFIFGLAIGSWATILFSKASMACQLPTWEIFVIYITIYGHLLLAFFVPTLLSLSLSWLFGALVIELDVAEFHLSLAWVPSGLSMINQRTNKFLSLRFCLCFHFCLLFRSNNNQQHGSASRVFCLTEL